MRRLADVCYGVAASLTAPIWLPRMIRTGKHCTDWAARLGRISHIPRPTQRRRVLIHAVSVGEVNACRLLIEHLLSESDRLEPVLAVTTDTGFARARALFSSRLRIVRYPFDFSFAVDRFLDAISPDLVVLVELEVWPNFVSTCVQRQIPVFVINGRLTARSHGRYRLIRPLVQPTFGRLALVAAQTHEYAKRFADLGTPAERIQVTGTMKWDTAQIADEVEGARALAFEMGIDRSRPLVVAGSTAPGEHELLHAAIPSSVQLLCAPRKPEWFEEAAQAMPGCVRRSQRNGARRGEPVHRFLLDTIGELRQAYALADLVIVGRTFRDLGGSDMIEPVALGKAVIVGPHVSNFRDVVDALLAGRGLVQLDAGGLAEAVRELLDEPAQRASLAQRGRDVIRTHQGATGRHIELILSALSQ